MNYVNKKYIKSNIVEDRRYQRVLADDATAENCIIVLPTGLGKTAVALRVIAEYMVRGTGAALFLAPTKVLASQHYEFLKSAMTIEDITLITGADTLAKRKKLWMASVICATPETARNDFVRNMVHPNQFAVVVFDEVHRAVGDYAYTAIAQRLVGRDVRILGMTATLPSEIEKTTEILTQLHISKVSERTDASEDVAPYIHDTKTEWMEVDLPPEMIRMQKDMKQALKSRYDILKGHGFQDLRSQSLSALLRIRPKVFANSRRSIQPLFEAIRIHYALNILEAHGITPFLKFCERSRKKGGPGTLALFEKDILFSRTIKAAENAQKRGLEHTKLDKLVRLLDQIPGKVLIFTSYRDSVDVIHEKLTNMGIASAILIGQAGKRGLKQKKQIETVRRFRDGQYRVLVSTRVGEEGLDIAEVNHVIFYDNVPSSIRYVQRKGRTGRKNAGRLIILIAKGTIDQTYYWIGKHKMKSAGTMGKKLSNMLKDGSLPVQTGLDAFD